MTSFELILPSLRPIQHLILDPKISEIMVNGSERVFVERAGVTEGTPNLTLTEKSLSISTSLLALLLLAADTTRVTSLRGYLGAFSLVLLVTMLTVEPQLARERAHPDPDSGASCLRFLSGFFFLLTPISAAILAGRTHTQIVPMAMRRSALHNLYIQQFTTNVGNDRQSALFARGSYSE